MNSLRSLFASNRSDPKISGSMDQDELPEVVVKSSSSKNKTQLSQTILSRHEIPTDIILSIFKFLSCHDLGRTSRVCKKWQQLASTESLWVSFGLKKLFPSLKIIEIDKTVWEKYCDLKAAGLEIEESPNESASIIALKKIFAFTSPIERQSVTLLTMPKGLKFSTLVSIAEAPIQGGDPVHFSPNWKKILKKLGNKKDSPVSHTYQVAITNSVPKESSQLFAKNQKEFVTKNKCKMVELLPMTAWIILQSFLFQKNSDCWNPYIFCAEQIKGKHVMVGFDSQQGIRIITDASGSIKPSVVAIQVDIVKSPTSLVR